MCADGRRGQKLAQSGAIIRDGAIPVARPPLVFYLSLALADRSLCLNPLSVAIRVGAPRVRSAYVGLCGGKLSTIGTAVAVKRVVGGANEKVACNGDDAFRHRRPYGGRGSGFRSSARIIAGAEGNFRIDIAPFGREQPWLPS